MANFCVTLQRQHGAKAEKPQQFSFEAEPADIDRGLRHVMRQWAEAATKGESLTISVRRDR